MNFDKIVFPMISRTHPDLSLNDLINVQPMSGPSGQVFYTTLDKNRDFKRNKRKYGIKKARVLKDL